MRMCVRSEPKPASWGRKRQIGSGRQMLPLGRQIRLSVILNLNLNLILIVSLSLSVSLWARARGSHRLKKQKMSVLEIMAGSASPGRNIRPFVRK